jgi:hypothetical protein
MEIDVMNKQKRWEKAAKSYAALVLIIMART